GEVVVTTRPGGAPLRTGDRVLVRTPAGNAPRTVVGTVAGRGFEDAVFFTDDEAARISPDIDALVVHADATAVRRALGPDSGMDVLTGHDRRRADPDPDRDARALVSVNALLGTAAGITLFVSAAVVASTFSFAVAQRRREFGLLRTAGATPGQIRRTVCAEAVLVGVLASAAGVWLGAGGAPLLVGRMTEAGLAPPWFALGDASWPLHTAFWAGVFVATAGALASCHRAGRTAPT
ncbi:ABC transporter permease, partial [Streptomyces anulatus]